MLIFLSIIIGAFFLIGFIGCCWFMAHINRFIPSKHERSTVIVEGTPELVSGFINATKGISHE